MTDPATGELFEKRRKHNHYRPRSPIFRPAGRSSRRPTRRSTSTRASSASPRISIQTNRVYPAGGATRDDRLFLTAKSPGYRDWRRHQPAAGGRRDQVRRARQPPQARDSRHALERARRWRRRSAASSKGPQSQRNETIGRLNWTRANLAGFSFEAGAEVALNTLDYQNDLFILGPGGARTRIDLPIDDATVQRNARRGLRQGRQAGLARVAGRRRAQLRNVAA